MLCVAILRTDGSGQVGILIGSQIPEKLPAVTDLTDKFQIKIGDHNFVFVFTALDQQLAARIYEIAGAVKFAEFPRFFQPDAIVGTDKYAIGDRLSRLLSSSQISV